MMKHLSVLGLAVPLLLGAEPPQTKSTTPNTTPRPIIIPPRTSTDTTKPKTGTDTTKPKTGIDVPKSKTDADKSRANPSINPAVMPRANMPIDVPEWTKVSPHAAGFGVSTPEEPKEQKQKVKAGTSEMDLTQYVVSLGDKGAYLVMYSDLPGTRTGDGEDIYKAARDRVVENLKGRLLNESKVQLSDTVGREIHVQSPAGVVVRDRMFVMNNRFYQVMVAGPRAFVNSPEA